MIPITKVTIYILTYNRPEFIEECVESALNQNYENFEVIVSDNSTNEKTVELLKKFEKNPKLKIIRRKPSLLVADHINLVLQELRLADGYCMLFHDDDVLLPSALSALMRGFERAKDASAVGGNAYVLRDLEKSKKLFMASREDICVKKPGDLVEAYSSPGRCYVPLPSYLYRSSAMTNLSFDPRRGGKYADVMLLLDVLKNGPLVMLREPIMHYRMHSSNDSGVRDLRASYSLVRAFKKMPELPSDVIATYKYKTILGWAFQGIRKNGCSFFSWRNNILLKHSIVFFFQSPFLAIRILFERVFE